MAFASCAADVMPGMRGRWSGCGFNVLLPVYCPWEERRLSARSGAKKAVGQFDALGTPEWPSDLSELMWRCQERYPDRIVCKAAGGYEISTASVSVAQGALLVSGVAPTESHPGYGYIQRGMQVGSEGVWAVSSFTQ